MLKEHKIGDYVWYKSGNTAQVMLGVIINLANGYNNWYYPIRCLDNNIVWSVYYSNIVRKAHDYEILKYLICTQ